MCGLQGCVALGHRAGHRLGRVPLRGALGALNRQGVLGPVQAHGLDADDCYQSGDGDSKPCSPVEEEG
jgi:hypothetical protein